MLKSILGLILAATTAVSTAAPAQAAPVRLDTTKEAVLGLVKVAENLGIRFQVDTAECKENKGLMGYMSAPHMVMTVCAENHQAYGEMALPNFADTIRHELLHAAQFCKATHSSNILFPGQVETSLAYAQEELGWNILGYPIHQWDAEGEARTVAHLFDEEKVGEILDTACRYTDTKRSMVGDIRLGRLPINGVPRANHNH
jgi:hypothetical protein